MSTRRSAFTLVEILVAIGIIGLLAAILFPVLVRVRDKSHQASCASHLRQLAHAFALYQQDHDSLYPYWDWNLSSNAGSRTPNHLESLWFNAIYSYVNSPVVFQCPTATDTRTLRQTAVFGWVDAGQFDRAGIVDALKDRPVHYAMSEMLSQGEACSVQGPCRDGGLDRPAVSLLLADGSQALTNALGHRPQRGNPADPRHRFIITRVAFANAPRNCYDDPIDCGATQTGTWDSFGAQAEIFAEQQTRHTRGSNLCFADGHVQWYPAPQITYDLFAGDGQL